MMMFSGITSSSIAIDFLSSYKQCNQIVIEYMVLSVCLSRNCVQCARGKKWHNFYEKRMYGAEPHLFTWKLHRSHHQANAFKCIAAIKHRQCNCKPHRPAISLPIPPSYFHNFPWHLGEFCAVYEINLVNVKFSNRIECHRGSGTGDDNVSKQKRRNHYNYCCCAENAMRKTNSMKKIDFAQQQ